jgi:hypothetical protein
MENVLKSLLQEKKEKEMIKLNAVEIVNALFNELQERERDILSRRFALKSKDYQTLEEIGQLHNLTRERVRQIERASLNKIKKINDFEKYLADLKLVVDGLMEEHGGIMEKNFLLDILAVLSYQIKEKDSDFDRDVYKNYLDFVLSELLNDHIERVDKSDKFSTFFKAKDQAVDYLEDLVSELKDKLKNMKDVIPFEELVDVLKGLKSFSANKAKFIKENSQLDLKKIFKDDIFPEWAEIIDKNKPFYSLMQAVKDINPNKFGYWGGDERPEIKPKRISDKIFLILKEEKKPLHSTEITKKINEVKFDKKKVSSGSVHNELILDARYILMDRGIYGLKEWKK